MSLHSRYSHCPPAQPSQAIRQSTPYLGLNIFLFTAQEEELVDVINLGTVSLSEVALQDGSLGSGGRRHSRGLVLRRAEAAAAAAVQQGQQQLTLPPLDDPSELESLLRSGRLARSSSSSSNLGLRCEELLAAEDAAQHSAWLSE